MITEEYIYEGKKVISEFMGFTVIVGPRGKYCIPVGDQRSELPEYDKDFNFLMLVVKEIEFLDLGNGIIYSPDETKKDVLSLSLMIQ